MAFDLGTLVTAVELLRKAIEIRERVAKLPKDMESLCERMEDQRVVLSEAENFVREYTAGANPILQEGQRKDLTGIINNIKKNAEEVTDLFDRYEHAIISRTVPEIQFRDMALAKIAAKIFFMNQPGKVQAIMDSIEHQTKLLGDYLRIAGLRITAQLLREQREQRKRERIRKQNLLTDSTKPSSPSKALTPSPSPLPPHRDYKILFVDPYNTGRSVIAQALLLLLGRLTTLSASKTKSTSPLKSPWRISQIASAGFFIRDKSPLSATITALPFSHKSYALPMLTGNAPPSPVGLAAVFDNTLYPYPFKSRIQSDISAHRSVGLAEDVFSTYDYIVVFTNREHDNMVRLKDVLANKSDGSQKGRAHKGRVLHLGTYIAHRNGAPKEILTVMAKKDHKTGEVISESRSDWNIRVAEIKTALKAFLRDEMKWERPDEGALKAALAAEAVANKKGENKDKQTKGENKAKQTKG